MLGPDLDLNFEFRVIKVGRFGWPFEIMICS